MRCQQWNKSFSKSREIETALSVCRWLFLCEDCGWFRHLLSNEINATTRKATPAQNKLPVRNHTTSAMMPAGKMNRSTLATSMIITIPMISSRNSSARSYSSGMSKGRGIIAKNSPLNCHIKNVFKCFRTSRMPAFSFRSKDFVVSTASGAIT